MPKSTDRIPLTKKVLIKQLTWRNSTTNSTKETKIHKHGRVRGTNYQPQKTGNHNCLLEYFKTRIKIPIHP